MTDTIRRITISDIESDIAARGYRFTLKQNENGTTVTLKHSTQGHTFEGYASWRSMNGFEDALKQAYSRMLAFETRHDR